MDNTTLKEWMEEKKESLDIGLPFRFNDIFGKGFMDAPDYKSAMEQLSDKEYLNIGDKRFILNTIGSERIEVVYMEDTADYSTERLQKVYKAMQTMYGKGVKALQPVERTDDLDLER